MIREVGFSDGKQARDGSHQLVIHPETTHRIVDSRIDHHRRFVRILICDLLIHLEEVAVLLLHHVASQTFDGIAEVEEYGKARIVHTITGIATFFGSTAGHITRHQVAEGRIATLQIVVALLFGNVFSFDLTALKTSGILYVFRHPDTTVITERLGHECQLGLVVPVYGNTSGMDLSHTWIGEESTFLVALPCGRAVRCHCIGRKEEGIAITARGNYHGMCSKAFDLTRHQIASQNTASTTVDKHHVEHLVASIKLHLTQTDLTGESRIGSKEQLLSRLTTSIESTRYLRSTERTVVQ